MPSSSGRPPAAATLDIRPLFNPIDCTSLGVVRLHLKKLDPGDVLEVLANRFQQQEVRAWARKFGHPIVGELDESGLVTIYLKRGT
ncbi:MAG: sulfurtransferase TusA family protein [Chloroflexi bacterium]|nr:sulfurtransferase TusA family protein [Chloroflexota bacterium]